MTTNIHDHYAPVNVLGGANGVPWADPGESDTQNPVKQNPHPVLDHLCQNPHLPYSFLIVNVRILYKHVSESSVWVPWDVSDTPGLAGG